MCACSYIVHVAFEKEPTIGSKHKANNYHCCCCFSTPPKKKEKKKENKAEQQMVYMSLTEYDHERHVPSCDIAHEHTVVIKTKVRIM